MIVPTVGLSAATQGVTLPCSEWEGVEPGVQLIKQILNIRNTGSTQRQLTSLSASLADRMFSPFDFLSKCIQSTKKETIIIGNFK